MSFNNIKNAIKNHKMIITIVVIVLLAAAYGVYSYTQKAGNSSEQTMAQATATRGSIEVTVTGTGTIVPIVDQQIGQDKSGTVKKIYVKNGDKVKEGEPLVELVDDSLTTKLENARLDLEKARLNLNETSTQLSHDTITAPFSGRIISLDTKKGEDISKGAALATIQDDSQLVFNMPVDSATAKKVSINQKVDVFLPSQGETVEGRVIAKNNQPVTGYNGENRVYLKVVVAATGNLSPETQAFGSLTIDGKQVDALSVSTLEWKEQMQIKATLTGEVTGLYVQEGQAVKKGQKLFALSSDTAANDKKTQQVAYKQALLSLAEIEREIEDLIIKAPIDGFVSGMDLEVGDEVWGKSSDSNTLTTSSNGSLGKIINTSQMEITFPADEVDIAKIKLGQDVDVSVDALSEQEFKGKVSEISEEGEVTNNVASFDVTILVDNSKNLLKSGMTANITIVAAQKSDAILIPIDALQEKDGNKFVLISPSEGSQQRRNVKQVTVGLTNDTYAEIKEGLKEGEKVLLPSQKSDSSSKRMMVGPGMGGPPDRH